MSAPQTPIAASSAVRHAGAMSYPSLADFAEYTDEQRQELGRRAAGETEGFTSNDGMVGEARLCTVRHQTTGMDFALIPGATLAMGLSDEELASAQRAAAGADPSLIALFRDSASPRHEVRVRPFLCAVAPVTRAVADSLLGTYADRDTPFWMDDEPPPELIVSFPAAEVTALVARSGLRLITEAEWEWVARAGVDSWIEGDAAAAAERFVDAPTFTKSSPVNRFGLFGLSAGEWVSDRWHSSYEGAPEDSAGWQAADPPEAIRGSAAQVYPWQDPVEVLLGHVAFRAPAAPDGMFSVRLAADLPAVG